MAMMVGVMLLASPGASAATGLGPDWVVGDGLWVVEDGICHCVALDSTDPKHVWIAEDFGNDYTVRADVRIDTWKDGDDMSRAGIGVRIQPDFTDGWRDEGLCLLLHNSLGRVEFLNDHQSWGDTQEALDWKVGTWYTFELTVTGTELTASIGPKRGSTPEPLVMTPWDASKGGEKHSREGGFPGLTGNSMEGGGVSFDNFEVIVGGEVVFSDDFETPGPPVASGLGAKWFTGDGLWVVHDGALHGLAVSGVDPKHAWIPIDFGNDYTVRADVRIDSWDDAQDHSRAGIGVRIQPDIRDGVSDDGLCLLFHDSLGRVEFLNDMQSWGDTQEALDWKVGTWYTFELTVTGTELTGSIGPKRGSTPEPLVMTPWDASVGGTKHSREGGYAGVTANTKEGGYCSFDNFEILVGGQVVFSDSFDEFISASVTSHAEDYQLYK